MDKPKADRPKAAASSLHGQTCALLRQMIDDGRIRPGERLMETQVAKAFAISRSPARSALQELLAERVIESDGRRGYRVSGGSTDANAHPQQAARIEPMRIEAPRRWEAMHDTVEQELLMQRLCRSVWISEPRLAGHFGVSRTVARELLARFFGYGLVEKDASGRWLGRQFTPDHIRHLYELRMLLEPHALRQAAPHIPVELLREARATILSVAARSHIEGPEFDQVENDLHIRMLSYGPNTELLNVLTKTHVLFAPTRYLLHPSLKVETAGIRGALDEHLAVVNLLAAGRIEEAVDTLRLHLHDAADRWMGRFGATIQVLARRAPDYVLPMPEQTEAA